MFEETISGNSGNEAEPRAESESRMTIKELKEQAWERSEANLVNWKVQAGNYSREHSLALDQGMKILEKLYGVSYPDRPIVVSFHQNSRIGSQKGEPANQLIKSQHLRPEIGDVFYWLPYPKGNISEFQKIPDSDLAALLTCCIHESEHEFLQTDTFRKLTEEVEADPAITAVLSKLASGQEHFIHVTGEMVTSYLDSYCRRLLEHLQPDQESKSISRFEFKVNRQDVDDVLIAVIEEDVTTWKQNGPYTRLRRGWEDQLGGLPKSYESVPSTTVANSSEKRRGSSIYQLAREVDTTLVDEYLDQGKIIDRDFIIRLYGLVGARLSGSK